MGNQVVLGAIGNEESLTETKMDSGVKYQYQVHPESYRNYAALLKTRCTLNPTSVEPFFGEQSTIRLTFEARPLLIDDLTPEQSAEILKNVKILRVKGFTLNEETTTVYQDKKKLYLGPWSVVCYKEFPSTLEDDYLDHIANYWSSLRSHVKFAQENRVFTHPMSLYPKTNHHLAKEANGSTNIASRIELSSTSQNKIMSLDGCVQNFLTDGDNQVWYNDSPYVFKMLPDKSLYHHELFIYSLDLPHLPRLIDSWVVEETADHPSEYFLCLENKGKSLSFLFGIKKLLPQEIKRQMEEILINLKKNGVRFGDPHLGNFTLDKEGVVWAIDAESMIRDCDMNLIEEIGKRRKATREKTLRDEFVRHVQERDKNLLVKESIEFLESLL